MAAEQITNYYPIIATNVLKCMQVLRVHLGARCNFSVVSRAAYIINCEDCTLLHPLSSFVQLVEAFISIIFLCKG